MAFGKKVDFKGISAGYHRIIQMNHAVLQDETVITFALYKDRDARDADKVGKANILETRQIIVPRVDGGLPECYIAVKNQTVTDETGEKVPGFYGDAKDILEKEK